MKLNMTGVLLFLMLGPAVAASADTHTLHDSMDASTGSRATTIDTGELRHPPPLREVLRQPVDREDGALKPYQLSPEERQRLREQLRSQSSQTTQNK